MGFLDTSVTTSTTANNNPATIAAAQSAVTKTTPTISKNISTAISSLVSKGGALNTLTSLTGSSLGSGNGLASAIKSISSVFGSDGAGLAKGIDSLIGNVFGDTNVATASTTATKISDPTATNLTAPKSTSFKLGSLTAGSQSVGMSGATSTVGSLASLMTGTSLSTVLNRYDLTSANTLNTSVGNASSGASISNLFTDLSTVINAVSKVTNGTVNGTSVNKISNTVTVGGTTVPTQTISPINATSNDISTFAGITSNLASAIGGSSTSPATALSGTNLASYYLSGNSNSPTLMTSTGTLVNTNNSGVDSVTANAILALAGNAGCTPNIQPYSSYQNTASMFNTAITLAANNGMTALVESMVGCQTASTPLGQQALQTAFVGSVGTQIEAAAVILGAIASPAALNTSALTTTIVTNPALTSAQVSSVDSIMSSLGTTTANSFTVPAASSTSYPVTDLSIISQASPSFSNAVMGDSAINDYLSGYQMTPASDGTLNCSYV